MKLDVVTKGIPFFHMSVVAVMVLVGVPRIFNYTSLFWVYCAIMSIPLTEEELYIEVPPLWQYRHLMGLGICFIISLRV
jgi:hypothetical protein